MTESAITKCICANNGSINTDELIANFSFGSSQTVREIIVNREKFVVAVCNGEEKVVAKTSLRICKDKDCNSCRNLHLCKRFLLGECQFVLGRRPCCFSHDLTFDHNATVLREHDLDGLHREELCVLLLQNDDSLLPPICYDYNNGAGKFGKCQDGDNCRRLHICQRYLRGVCNCPRAHDFYEPHPFNALQRRGVPYFLIPTMKLIYMNKEALKVRGNKDEACSTDIPAVAGATGSTASGDAAGPSRRQTANRYCVKDNMICMYFIKGHCIHGDRCFKVHHNLPYRWEVREGQQWTALPGNEEIEKDYCDPKKTYSRGTQPVCFDTMTCGLNKARRLSTISSVVQPNFILTTEWVWYWEDEFGNWNQYASATAAHRMADVSSAELEQKFLNDDKDVMEFTAGSQNYTLSFQDMIQTNKQYSTKRLVKRRPVFVSSAEARTMKTRKPQGNQSNFKALPAHWDKTQIPDTGYKRVTLLKSSGEYKEIEDLFRNTMRGFDILHIERIQNKTLWEFFQLQKDVMRKTSGGQNIAERKLFHGTDSKHIDAICLNNFDWRICGTHGTAFGKGSYFARDANYSHNYTSQSNVKSMFICRILVGDYTTGSSSYLRPPSKYGGDTLFYDSCVDDAMSPSIFVVFEKHQIYPEYLLTYEEEGLYPFLLYYRTISTVMPSAPKPKPSPSPRISAPTPQLSSSARSSSVQSTTPQLSSSALSSSLQSTTPQLSSSARPSLVQSTTPQLSSNARPSLVQSTTPQLSSNALSFSVPSTTPQLSSSALSFSVQSTTPQLSSNALSFSVPSTTPQLPSSALSFSVPSTTPQLSSSALSFSVQSTTPQLSSSARSSSVQSTTPQLSSSALSSSIQSTTPQLSSSARYSAVQSTAPQLPSSAWSYLVQSTTPQLSSSVLSSSVQSTTPQLSSSARSSLVQSITRQLSSCAWSSSVQSTTPQLPSSARSSSVQSTTPQPSSSALSSSVQSTTPQLSSSALSSSVQSTTPQLSSSALSSSVQSTTPQPSSSARPSLVQSTTPQLSSSARFSSVQSTTPQLSSSARFSSVQSTTPQLSSSARFSSVQSTTPQLSSSARFSSVQSTAPQLSSSARSSLVQSITRQLSSCARSSSVQSTAPQLSSSARFSSVQSTTPQPSSSARFSSVQSTTPQLSSSARFSSVQSTAPQLSSSARSSLVQSITRQLSSSAQSSSVQSTTPQPSPTARFS
ncbi:protein mono-ADP-ribosyltransferase PARP12-like [Polymixia lowei]